jgi:hypothetical protein
MQNNTERWMEIAKLASTERDPVRLLALITEIKLMLEKEEQLIRARARQPENSK